jgi:hypothetical protein
VAVHVSGVDQLKYELTPIFPDFPDGVPAVEDKMPQGQQRITNCPDVALRLRPSASGS